jgi:OsmC-like protein
MERYTWTLRVGTTSQGGITAFVRKQQFSVGAPVQFDEEYAGITALEYVLGAIGADVVHGLQSLARKRRVAIDHIEAVVQGELNNPLTYLGVVGESGHPGLERVRVKVYLASLAIDEDIQQLWQEMLARSPLVRTFQSAIAFELSLQVLL